MTLEERADTVLSDDNDLETFKLTVRSFFRPVPNIAL